MIMIELSYQAVGKVWNLFAGRFAILPGENKVMTAATKSLWKKFLILFVTNILVSIVVSIGFYLIFGKEVRLTGKHLEIDFFNTVCGVFTIIGLGIAIYQIAALRREEEIIHQTSRAFRISRFKETSAGPVGTAIGYLTELQGLVNASDYNKVSLTGFLDKVNQTITILSDINNQQVILNCGTIIDCENCLTLLRALQNEFSLIVDENRYADFKRTRFNIKIGEVIALTQKCEAELKTT